MKSYSKFLTLLILALCFSFASSAQSQAKPLKKISVGLNIGQSPNTESFGLAIGGDLRYQLNITKWLSMPITVGFTSIKQKDRVLGGYRFEGQSRSYYPLKFGIKGNFNKTGFGLYGLLEGGFVINLVGLKGAVGLPGVFSPAIGYTFKNGIDVAIKLEAYKNEGFIGTRIGYAF
ncbi:hypothetical protein WG904_13685 [Pedobacter sp. Du54]|uniref:hypothetical protein n=1 Tax=Pedobacter anseongensis TaxID=3133439 RepID=UPI0030A0F5D2